MTERVFDYSFAKIYALYVQKVTRKKRSVAELDAVLSWLTGYAAAELHDNTQSLREFFAAAPMNPAAKQITGVVCGVRVENIADPLLQQIRWMDKVVDELAKGKAVAAIQRS